MRVLISLVLLLGSISAARAERLPTEVFAQPSAFGRMTMSWDGKYVAYVAEFEHEERVFIRSVEKGGDVLGVDVPALGANLFGRIGGITWISPKRLLVATNNGYIAIDRDGKDYGYLTGWVRSYQMDRQDNVILYVGGLIHVSRAKDSDKVLLSEFDPVERQRGTYLSQFPNIIKMDTRSGKFSRELENPGDVTSWITDREGTVRVGVKLHDTKLAVIYRENENAAWRELPGMTGDMGTLVPMGLNDKATELYVAREQENGLGAIYTYDLAKNRLGELVLSHQLYDIDALSGARLIYAPNGRLLGVRYLTDISRVLWFDPTFAAIQRQLDAALPNAVNYIGSITDDEQVMLVASTSAKNPGTYYIFDRTKGTLGKFVDTRPWVKPETMAEMMPLKITSRDGLKLYGYLTIPNGAEMKNLPMIVMPHGGPWARDTYGFNPEVQFLANRGYAVLQINFRGSVGYGRSFFEKGFKVVGTKMQDDIEDATRWAINKGIADPKRVGIMGSSFGGYSTLMGLIRTPELYRCGIDIAGVTDWGSIIENFAENNPLGRAFNTRMVGDPKTDGEMLRAVSPAFHAEKITAPLLIVHGHDDPVVPYDQAKALMSAMDKAGRPYEALLKYNEPHGIFNYKNRIELYNRIETFLTKHMPATAPAAATN